jgi:malonyl-CoA/methylmalonyl-CoA synthetase
MDPFTRASQRFWAQHLGSKAWSEAPRSLSGGIFTQLKRDPSRVVASFADGSKLNRSELYERAAGRAALLIDAGVEPGDVVALRVTDVVLALEWTLGILFAGAVLAPFNPAAPAYEYSYLETLVAPKVVISESSYESPEALRVIDAHIHAGQVQGSEPVPRGVDDGALIFFTSGTTGRPKAVLVRQGALAANLDALMAAWGWSEEDTLCLTLPLFHMHGLGVGLLGSLWAGGALYLRGGFDAAFVLNAARECRATMLFGVPTIYHRLAEATNRDALSSLRLIVSGSAPLSVELHEAMKAASGSYPLERYGMSETAMLTSNPLRGVRKPGSVGFELPGVRLRLSSEYEGEILVQGPNVFREYLDNPVATEEAFVDGWFRTGDIGQIDQDGYLSIVGRAKELIITGGYNVYPREVEEVIATVPGVREAAVVGEPSSQWGEIVVAYVVGESDPDTIRTTCSTQLSPYKCPREIRFVDALPRNHMGKIQRHLLGN